MDLLSTVLPYQRRAALGLCKLVYITLMCNYHGGGLMSHANEGMMLLCVCLMVVSPFWASIQHVTGVRLCLSSGRLLVGTFVALFFNLLTLLSVRNKPFSYVSEGSLTHPFTRLFRWLPAGPASEILLPFLKG